MSEHQVADIIALDDIDSDARRFEIVTDPTPSRLCAARAFAGAAWLSTRGLALPGAMMRAPRRVVS
jgi:hypothetical protein